MNSKHWKWFIPGHIACLPFTLLYAVACWIAYGARSWGIRNGVLVCIGEKLDEIFPGTGAQTIGACQCYASSKQELRDDLHVHENVHIIEAFIGSIFGYIGGGIAVALGASPWWLLIGGMLGVVAYKAAYVAIFLARFLPNQSAGWHPAYRGNIFEVWAYDTQEKWTHADEATKAKAWT